MAEAWRIIEQASSSRFTGELTLVTACGPGERTTNIYMNRGFIYLAEHQSDPPLATRLGDAGTIPAGLHDFMVGGADENIDALFEIDPSVSREPAEHAIQSSTETVLLEIAVLDVTSSTTTTDRHHPSGVDRWFSSQSGRLDGPAEACHSTVDTGHLERIVPSPEPVLIPHLQLAATPSQDDVAAAVSSTVAALDAATKAIGVAPAGVRRGSDSIAPSH